MIGLLLATAMAMLVTMVGTPALIRFLRARGIGQEIRDDGPEGHHAKRGTPTMGGVIIIVGLLVGYLAAHVPFGQTVPVSKAGLLTIGVICGMAALGFVDDYIKVRRQRSLGLNKTSKFLGQLLIAGLFAWAALGMGAPTKVGFFHGGVELTWLFLPWALVMISAASNGVNLTDGLDGLAAGSSGLVYAAYLVICFWQFTHSSSGLYPGPEALDSSLDLSVIAGCMVGASFGFLWWNAAPAKIFMGDTGALALGGGMAVLAMLTSTPLLLIVLGGLYVIETLSVIIQVASFRIWHRRIFKMAPIHHHFELIGWPEFTVIVRFWIVAGICVAFGLGLFYADFLQRGGAG